MLEESTMTLKELRERSMRQADDDAAAYGSLNALWSRPADDPERVDGFQDAVRGAIKAPGAIMETSCLILEVLERLPGCSAPHLASDLAIAIETATMALPPSRASAALCDTPRGFFWMPSSRARQP